jgi:hypothetical protein
VEPLIASGVGATVPPTVRETVEAVHTLLSGRDQDATVSVTQIATALDLDKAPTSRRVKSATERGYLVNHEDRKGRRAKIALGEPLPADEPILPEPKAVANCCADAPLMDGYNHPSPPCGGAQNDLATGEAGDDKWTR